MEGSSGNYTSLVGSMLTPRDNNSLFETDGANRHDSDNVSTLDVGLLNVLIKIPNLQKVVLPMNNQVLCLKLRRF